MKPVSVDCIDFCGLVTDENSEISGRFLGFFDGTSDCLAGARDGGLVASLEGDSCCCGSRPSSTGAAKPAKFEAVGGKRNLGSRYLHLLDSSVAQGVLTKHRSTSFQLQRVVRRQCAVELIAQIKPIYAFVRSSMNPADWPSRRLYARFEKDHKRR